MTDRLAGVLITFEQDIREDDAESTIAALRHIRGVLSVEPIVADVTLHMAEQRALQRFKSDLLEVFER